LKCTKSKRKKVRSRFKTKDIIWILPNKGIKEKEKKTAYVFL